MGRKRNQGRARKAAKAKQEAEERGNNNSQTTANEPEEQIQRIQSGNSNKCMHGGDVTVTALQFTYAFFKSFDEARGNGLSILKCLTAAHDVTMDEYAEVWIDSAKMELAISCLLCKGTEDILDGEYDLARLSATFARYFEEHIAVVLKETQALFRWNKFHEAPNCDQHTLVKFFRKRIPCSCLDEKYEEVKDIPKMGICFSSQCTLPNGRVEYSKTMYCDRCRSVTYCSRECQIADWKEHKDECGIFADQISEFEATKQA
mmetsp:Transcript_9467/g.14455  ORF Transcript_9467/g.14455 Transcript_9467/m.14455 type:complete len:261 (-) Transcript_9467:62-844(-)